MVLAGVVAAVLVGGGIAGVAVATTGAGSAEAPVARSSASASTDPGAAANGSGTDDTSGFQDPAAPAARSTATPVRSRKASSDVA